MLFQLPSLTASSGNVDSAVPEHVQEAPTSNHNDPNAADENKLDQRKSTASATAKLLLRGRTKANKQAIESLVHRVEALSTLLCVPIPQGDIKEKMRREELEQYACALQG